MFPVGSNTAHFGNKETPRELRTTTTVDQHTKTSFAPLAYLWQPDFFFEFSPAEPPQTVLFSSSNGEPKRDGWIRHANRVVSTLAPLSCSCRKDPLFLSEEELAPHCFSLFDAFDFVARKQLRSAFVIFSNRRLTCGDRTGLHS